jgi:DNA-binding NarL/FixJ family response regulator
MAATTVVIVDQQPILSQGLAMALADEADLRVVGSVAHAGDALELALELMPDVVVLDPEIANPPFIEGLRAMTRPPAIILLYPTGEPSAIERAGWIGATTLVMRDTSLQDLVTAIHEVAAAREEQRAAPSVIPPAPQEVGGALESLSPRETQILELLTLGLSQRAIANRLNLAVNTVRTHTRNIQLKLRVHSNLEAVSFWLSHRSHVG